MKRTVLLLLAFMALWVVQAKGQWSVTAVETDFTIDFDNTVTGVNEGQFNGTGFATTPATGQLDADAWAVGGMSDLSGLKDFGVEVTTTGDYARGALDNSTHTTSGGLYAFEVETGNYAMGVQASTADFTPGWIALLLTNNSGETVNYVDMSYDIWVYNDDGRSSSFNGEFSLDGSTWIPITELEFTTTEVADASPAWAKTTLTFSDFIGTEIADGGSIYFRWYSDDVLGSGSRDEIAVDNFRVNISYAPTALSFPFYETYETWPLENWTIEGTSSYVWESSDGTPHGPGSVYEGSFAAMFNVYNASSGTTTTMTTNVIDMSSPVNPILQFQYWMEGGADSNLWIKAEISTDGSTWTEVFYQEQDGVISDWTEAKVHLTGYNSTTQIRITGSSDYGSYNLFIDDLQVYEGPTTTLTWNNLQYPENHTMFTYETVDVYAQAYEDGVTNADAANPGTGVECWIGYSVTDTDPSTWTNWIAATYNVDQGNNDEFQASLGSLASGTYYYASRWRLDDGPYTYGGYSSGGGNFWDGTTYVSGVLTVNAPVGANCSNPYTLAIPADLPYGNLSATNCGWEHNYEDTNISDTDYDSGEDAVYEITVASDTYVRISLDPKTTSYSSVSLFDACPDTGNLVEEAYTTGSEIRVIDVLLSAGTYYLMIDTYTNTDCIAEYDLTIEDFCPAPTSVEAINITPASAEIQWGELGLSSDWHIKVNEGSSIDPTTEDGNIVANDAVNTTPSYSLSSLNPTTDYYVYIQSDCGSEWSSEYMFTTPCVSVSTYPFFEGFEDASISECWTILNEDADSYQWVINTGYYYEGSQCASIHWNSSVNDDWLISPHFDVTSDNLKLEFFAKSNSSSFLEDYNVLISTTGTAPSDFTTVLDNITSAPNSWEKKEYVLSDYGISSGSSIYVAIQCVSNNEYYLLVDSFTLREQNSENDILTFVLAEETGPATINDVAHTVDIEVTMGTDVTSLTPTITVSDYASIDPVSGVAQDFSTPFNYTVTAEDLSEQIWTVNVTAATAQSSEKDILTFSITEETGAATIGANTVDIEVNFTADISSLTPAITVSNLATISPESGIAQNFTSPVTYTVTAEDATTKDYTVTVTQEATPLGAGCDNPMSYTNINDPEVVTSINATSRKLWFTVTLDQTYYNVEFSTCPSVYDTKLYVYDACGGTQLGYDDDSPDAYCSVDNNQSLIEMTSLDAGTYYVLITPYDENTDISDPTTGLVVTGSNCEPPTDVIANSLTSSSAIIDWTPLTLESGWNIKVSSSSIDPTTTDGDIVANDVVNTTPTYPLSSLDPNTNYYVYIQAVCGSEWSSEYVFTTECEVLTVFPFEEDFDGDWGTWCWDVVNNDGDSYEWSQDNTYISPTHSGTYAAHGMGNNDDYLISPQLALSGNMKMTWWDIVEGAAYNNTYDVLVSTTDKNLTSFVDNLGTFDCTNTSWTQHEVDLSAYDGMNIYIAFYQTYSDATNWGFGIDDVVVRAISGENDILTFAFAEQTGPAVIDDVAHTVDIEVANGTALTSLTPTITVSDYASIDPASGVAQDFSSTFNYTVTAEDLSEQIWAVSVTEAATQSSEKDILTFSIPEETGAATIGANTVDIEVAWDTDISNLTPTITISALATISPESDIAQDFSSPVTYTVTAEDATTKDYTVTVTLEAPPAGAICGSAINYGTINDPAMTGTISEYQGVWFTFTTTEPFANVDIHTCGSNYDTKLAVYEDCGDVTTIPIYGEPEGVIGYNDDANPSTYCSVDNNQSLVEFDVLPAGTYYVILYPYDTEETPGDYEIEILGDADACLIPSNIVYTDLQQEEVTLTWDPGFTETEWNLIYGPAGFDILTEGTTITNVTTPYNLTLLTADTEYDVYVQAICAGPSTSDWSDIYTFTTLATCPVPTDIVITTTATSATASWNGWGATLWNIKASLTAIDPETEDGIFSTSTSDNPFSTGDILDPNTTYYCYIQTDCGGETSTWLEGTFTTDCDVVTEFTEGFDLVTASDMPDCWYKVGTNGSAYTQTSNNLSSPNCLYMYSSSTSSTATVAMQPVSNAGDDTHFLKFNARANYTAGAIVEIGYLTDPADASSFVSLGSETLTMSYQEFEIYPGTAPGTNNYLAFRASGSPAYSLLIDDVEWLEIPSCLEPTDLVATNITGTEATISWTASASDPANGYDYYVSESTTAPDAGTTPTGSVAYGITTADLSSLTENTSYYFWIRANCDGVDYSEWTDYGYFYTGYCISIGNSSTYYIDNFETTGGTDNISNLSSGYSTDGYEDATSMVVSQFAEGTVNFTASFGTLTSYTFGLGIWVDWNNDMDFDDTDEEVYLSSSYNSSYADQFDIPAGIANGDYRMRVVANYNSTTPSPCNGSGINGETEDYILSVIDPPSCMVPTGLFADMLTTSSAYLNWTETGSADTWNIKVSSTPIDPSTTDGDIIANESTMDNPYTSLSGLTPATQYYFYVQADCGSGDLSDWSVEGSFYSNCEIHTIPYFYGFEDTEISNCWTILNIDGDENLWTIGPNDGTAYEGSQTASITYNASGNDDWLITPQFDITSANIDNLVFEFYARSRSDYFAEDFNVLISTTGTSPTDFTTVVENITNHPATWELHSYHLSDYGITSGQQIYIAIQSVSVDEFELYVDAFAIRELPQIDQIDINSDVADISVCEGTDETTAIADLAAQITITDTDAAEYVVDVTWSIDSYDGNTTGDYNATGTFELPTGVVQTDPVTALEVSAVVTVSAPVDATFSFATEYCIGATADALPTTSDNGITGTWAPATIATDVAGTADYVFTADAGQCANGATIQVTINDLPVVTCPETMAVTFGSSPITLEGATPADGVYSGTNVTDGEFDPTGLTIGQYTMTYTYTDATTGCSDYCEFIIDIVTNIETVSIEGINIYPNPNNGQFTIDFTNIEGHLTYQLYDTKGSVIILEDIAADGNTVKEVSVDLVPGVYYVKVVTAKQTYVEKLVIE